MDPELQQRLYENQLRFDFNSLKLKAQKRAIEDKLTSYYKKLIDNDETDDFDPATNQILPVVKSLKVKTDTIYDTKNGKNPYCFFTVNLKPDYTEADVVELYKVCKSFFSTTTYVKNGQYIWSMEQRSEDEEVTTGYHIHILFEKGDASPSKIERAFKNKFFDQYVGTVAALDWRYCNEAKPKVRYILGIKEDTKMQKIKIDRIMKTRLGLPMYENAGFQDEISKAQPDLQDKLLSHDIL